VTINKHEFFMKAALDEAYKAIQSNEVPVGALLVYKNEIISRSHNTNISAKDPTAHAEINVIRDASKKLGNYRLLDTTLFVTLEPCAMCYGAIVHARISKIIFGARDLKTGFCGSCEDLSKNLCFNHTPNITGGVLEKDCSLILKKFFKDKRN